MSNRKLHLRGATLIRNLYHGLHYPISTLAKLFNLSELTIVRILRNEQYPDKHYNPTPSVLPLRNHYDKYIVNNPEYSHLAYENTFTQIKGFPRYIIFVDGAVFSDRGFCYKKLVPRYGTSGYECYVLSNNKTTRNYNVHRLIAEHFIPNPNNHKCVLHINDIKTDNRLSNLKWGSYADNRLDATRNGRFSYKIPDFTRSEIYKTITMFSNISIGEIARRFGISNCAASKIKKDYENQQNQ